MAPPLFTRRQLAQHATLSESDLELVRRCRMAHTRCGLAYQIGFTKMHGRLPRHDPLETIPELVVFLSLQCQEDPTIVVRDVMCEGHLDILLPTDGGFSLWEGDGAGGFAPRPALATGYNARSADLGDLDHDALSSPDIVLGNDDGSVTLVRNDCQGNFVVEETEQFLGASLNVPEMKVLLGEFCPEYSNELAVAAGASSYGAVSVACGDGTGTILSIPGAYGGTTPVDTPEIDYRWVGVQAQTLGAWPDANLVQKQALYAMRETPAGRSILSRLLPSPGGAGGAGGPYDARIVDLAELEGEASYSELEIHRLTGQSGEMWHRAVFVGPEGFGAVQ